MAPSPQELTNPISINNQNGKLTGDEIVISGISGLFPNSKNILEFMENLYNQVDMVTKDENLKFDHAELPQYFGKVRVSEIDKFDAHFFRVTTQQARTMDEVTRKMMEQAYRAMYDAGVNPLHFKGKNVGVFISALYIETFSRMLNEKDTNNFVISGVSKNMIANRISYWLDSKGPSYEIESLLGSTLCLEHAYKSIMTGTCEAAIVGGVELNIDETLSVNMRQAGVLCLDGKSKCFDKNGDGRARSQAGGVLFLQKAKDAKRMYAEVCKIELKFGLKPGAHFSQNRDPEAITEFLKNIYNDICVCPDGVEYVEANGAAHPEADCNELQAIGQVFGKRKTVKVGSVKSNMGNSESYSGVCSVIKLCLAYHKGLLPGNLHYNDPLDVHAVKTGQIEILTKNAHFNRGYAAINSFPYDGSDSHIVLKGHFKPKNLNVYKCDIPRLVLISGRHEKGVEKIFDTLTTKPIDPEFIGLLNNIYQVDTPGFTNRGYTILDNKEGQTLSLAQSTELYQGLRRPLWFMYSGMGSQWLGMGAELMRIPIFAAAIEKCRRVLEHKGIDIVQILTTPEKSIFDNVINCFVGIAAVQIGLTDVLKKIGLIPDYMIGHSLGEMGCAYCDGCFSAEEMMLTAYSRGLASIECASIKGSMAAVGLGYDNILPLCPSEIDVACRNSSEFSTISGPSDVMKMFIGDLKAKGVFVKEVQSANIAFHSRYMQKTGQILSKKLINVIKNPVKRSKKWICTSLPEEKRNGPAAEFSSAEYHVNNLVNPVYFEDAARQIPNDAVVVEVSPHGLMQAILKRSHPECIHIPITRRAHDNPLKFLLEALGKLYQEGYDLKVDVLYPKIEYPVSTETDILSHLVEWYHEDDWYSGMYTRNNAKQIKKFIPQRALFISMQDDDFKFLAGHVRKGNTVLPEAAVLFYVWETLAMYYGVNHEEMSVGFRDVQFYAEIILEMTEPTNLNICINKGNHFFEVTNNEVVIANGNIMLSKHHQKIKIADIGIDENDIELNSSDIYNIMKFKGYHYQDDFQSIYASSLQCNYSQIFFSGSWITFLDSLIQLNIIARNHEGVSIPKIIKEIKIDVNLHAEALKIIEGQNTPLGAQFCKTTRTTKCGGVMIRHIVFDDKFVEEQAPDVLKTISFNSAEQNQEDDISLSNSNITYYELISTKTKGMRSLEWAETEANTNKSLKVFFAGTSIRDFQNYIGLAGSKRNFGMDFSGIDSKGNRVMGLIAGGALASRVKPDLDLLWPVPDYWSLEEASTVPLPYVHALYCLNIRYRLQPGQSVFVTGGAGALGQAVIAISLSLGCTVYTCVSDIQKKQFLARLFPNLNENNIGCSRDISFLNMVVNNTENKLCNVVINCASGQLREFAMKCVGFNEQFLDISDYDMKMNEQFNMWYLKDHKTYKKVDLSRLFSPEQVAEKKLLGNMISEGIANGTVKPISYVVYSPVDVDRAFRLLSLSRHRGRVLIKFTDLKKSKVIPRITYSSDGAYAVICEELLEQGVQLINHLISRGAEIIIIYQQSKNISGFSKLQVASWQNLGTNVTFSTNYVEMKKIITMKIHGIFVIHPDIKKVSNLDAENVNMFTTLVDNLDYASRNNCPDLKYFVILASHNGNFVDQETLKLKEICEKRVQLGLPGLFLLTYMIGDLEHMAHDTDVRPVSTQTSIKAMEISLKRNSSAAIAYNENWETSLLQTISRVMGITDITKVDQNLRVKDLVSYELKFEEIRYVIKECRKLDLSAEYIKEMTIKSLKSLTALRKKIDTQFDSKMAAFYNFVDDDEIRATDTFMPLLTLASWTEGKENLHAKANNLLLVPGFEGHHYIFKPLSEKIKMRATTLQYGPDICNSSIQAIALDLKQRMKDRFTLEPKFYLLGYSFGVNVALEIAALLEKDGLVGVVYCLDSSPDALRMQLDAYLGNLSENQLQNSVIKHLFYVMTQKHCDSLERYIECTNNWNEKVDKCVEHLKEHVNYSNEYKKAVIEAFYDRITIAKGYNPSLELNSKIILLKGRSHPNIKGLPVDYGLSKYAKNPIEILSINSDVASAPYDNQVANYVNRFLDPALLEDFKAKNFCERYIL